MEPRDRLAKRAAPGMTPSAPTALAQNPFKMTHPRLCHPGAAKQSPGSMNATTQTASDGAQTAEFMGSGLRFAAPE